MQATVKDVMTIRVVWVRKDATFKELAATLRENQVSAFPVLDDGGKVIGVVFEADLLIKVALGGGYDGVPGMITGILRHKEQEKARGITTDDLMTGPAVTVAPEDTVEHAARLMYRRRVKRLTVVDADGHLAGIISRADVLTVFDRSDEEICEEIAGNVIPDEFLAAPYAFTVTVKEGVVTLAGKPDTSEVAASSYAGSGHGGGPRPVQLPAPRAPEPLRAHVLSCRLMPGSVRERDDTDVDCRMLTERVDGGWLGPVRDCVPRRAGVALVVLSTVRATQAGLPLPAITWEAAASCRVPSLSAGRYPAVHRTGHSLYSRPPPGALPVSTVTRTRLPQDRRSLPVSPAARGANLLRLNVPWPRQQTLILPGAIPPSAWSRCPGPGNAMVIRAAHGFARRLEEVRQDDRIRDVRDHWRWPGRREGGSQRWPTGVPPAGYPSARFTRGPGVPGQPEPS